MYAFEKAKYEPVKKLSCRCRWNKAAQKYDYSREPSV